MSISLYDTNGILGQAATNTGFQDADNAISNVFDSGKGLYLKQLFAQGYTIWPAVAAREALLAAHQIKDNQVRSTLISISELLDKAKDFAVVKTD